MEDSQTKPQNSDYFDSPYKKSLSEIKIIPGNDDPNKDFRTPKPIKVQKKSQNKRPAPLKQTKLKSKFSKTKSAVNKNSIFKDTRDNFGLSDVNPDHLQMALALSKSTYAIEYPELSKNTEDTFPNFLTPEKIPKGKTTLERYGFKSDKPKLRAELKREPIEPPKKNKNSKFRFITPTLKTRTVEERESIIATKISLVLCSNADSYEELHEVQTVDELYSDMLKKFKGSCSIFATNAFSFDIDKYYNKTLNMSPSKSKCGCLLKNWNDIPGREKSPIRNRLESEQAAKNNFNNMSTVSVNSSQDSLNSDTQINNKTYNKMLRKTNSNSTTLSDNLCVEYSTKRYCISPDLFESESESEYMQKSPDTVDDFSQSLLSPSKKQQKSRSSQNDSFENILKRATFKTDISLDLVENNTNEKSQKSLPSTKKESNANITKNIVEYSEDEDTEILYINSLKEKEEFVVNLTEDFSSTNYKDNLSITSPEDKKSCSKPQQIEEFIVDLTLSSDDDVSNHYSTDQMDNKLNTDEVANTKLNEKILTKNTEYSDTNFEMSPLYLKDSGNTFESENVTDYSNVFTEKSLPLRDIKHSRHSTTSFRMSVGLDGFDYCNATLNVTDYVTQILNQNESKNGENNLDSEFSSVKTINNTINNLEEIRENSHFKCSGQDEDNGFTSSQESCSKESIIISDEELNYSSIHSKDTKSKRFYELSDAEEISETNRNKADLIDIDEVYSIHSALKNKYKGISTPVHNRISELRGNSPLTRVSITAALEDSFNDILENPDIVQELENDTNEKLIVNPSPVEITDNTCTPEKALVASNENVTTPENNFIIKTSNVTPLVNYDAMDTPGITKELQKFGLKPLKRQRGVKLLKYIYECTHPLVGPGEIEELSSDEETQKRVVKKRRKSSNSKGCNINPTDVEGNIPRCDQSDIEIVGDALLKNENFDELIFERKFSVKIHSCRVPLQIVWHNFLSQNEDIKENILLYEPLQLEVLHTMMKKQTGCKFHIQDLLTFFDKKCITIRTAQGSQRKTKF